MFSIHAYTHSAVFIAFRLAHTTASLSLGAPLTFLSLSFFLFPMHNGKVGSGGQRAT